ncbi:MAG: hypothetical protein NPIRA03_09710 [Nitrospirales bacterium]|nr:MAG: hypothetical protein NPIRA03_09710 [Nitrospirales bacterium]
MRYWLVTCPEEDVQGGVWLKWYKEKCVAIGWPPNRNKLEGDAAKSSWAKARNRLKEMKPDDKVIPFLRKWRIGPIGKIVKVKASDTDWLPTVEKGNFKRNPKEAELGRRIFLEWENDQMPVHGQIAKIPEKYRKKKTPLTRQTIKEISKEDFESFANILRNPDNWVSIEFGAANIKSSPGTNLSQRFLREGFERILNEYKLAYKEPKAKHSLAQLITEDMPNYLEQIIPRSEIYKIEGSAGKGNWAGCPWIAIFDRQITESAQSGYYPVFLFKENMKGVYLSLNQGITDIKERYKENPRKVLRRYALDFRGQLEVIPEKFSENEINLEVKNKSDLASYYEDGNICARFYPADSLPNDEQFIRDIGEILEIYSFLVDRDKEVGEEEDFGVKEKNFEDLRKFRAHKRYERNQGLAKKAKKIHKYKCQACGFHFVEVYGPIGKDFIEAHHLRTLSLFKGQKVSFDPKADFAVLCSNCHRMIHRYEDPGDLKGFRSLIGKKEL